MSPARSLQTKTRSGQRRKVTPKPAAKGLVRVKKGLKSSKLSLPDILSRLSPSEVEKLLGEHGKRLMMSVNRDDGIDITKDVQLTTKAMTVRLEDRIVDPSNPDMMQAAVVSILLRDDATKRLFLHCSACNHHCEHIAEVFNFLLHSKSSLSLAVPPKDAPPPNYDEETLCAMAINDRLERSELEKMIVKALAPKKPWSDYLVSNRASGKTYRVALRGMSRGDSYCSCPDFRTNTLGTCKHILKVLSYVRRIHSSSSLSKPYQPERLAVHLKYGSEVSLQISVPPGLDEEAQSLLEPLVTGGIRNVRRLISTIGKLEQLGHSVHIFPDAEEFIQHQLFQDKVRRLTDEIRQDPANHPLRTELLKVPLLPYQIDGIAFAVAAGRAIIADEMGLGKTIQAIGTAELLAKEAGITRALIVCPTSLKSQWRSEIAKFSGRSVQLISGPMSERHASYQNSAFFTVCNYEQVLRDIKAIEAVNWDLVILDEGQRIKNWESRTSRVIKTLKSRFAVLLSGTPLENRLDDLYSVVQFVDDRRLGPGFRFFHRHRRLDEKGRTIGYRELDIVRDALRPVLLRRTRDSIRLQLPERTTEFIRVAPSKQQFAMHTGFMHHVQCIVNKKFLTEMDLLLLQKYLLMARMSCNGTALVDKKKPGFSTKLECLDELLSRLCEESDRKIVLFSEWTTMLDMIEPILDRIGVKFVRLDGSVPQKARATLVNQFQEDPNVRLFITTNAGSTGLNLQAANTVVNVDLPWNPAVLEQRIARAHRMGQKREVQVYILVTEGTIEEGLINTLAAKKDLAMAALDADSDVTTVDIKSSRDDLKRRLELLLGSIPAAHPGPAQEDATEDMAEANRTPEEAEQQAADDEAEDFAVPASQETAVDGFIGAESLPSAAASSQPTELAADLSESSSGENGSVPTSATQSLAANSVGAGSSSSSSGSAGEPAHRERVAAAGGELLGAAFRFLGELVALQPASTPPTELVGALQNGLTQCVESEESGRPVLRISLPDRNTLDGLALTLARLLTAGTPPANGGTP